MKKLIPAAVLCLLLLLSFPVRAAADELFPAPDPVEAGSHLNHLLASVAPDSSVSAVAETLPTGVELIVEPGEASLSVWLRGIPVLPGIYNCIINLNGSSTICPLTVLPATPSVEGGGAVSGPAGQPLTLSVSASAGDGGALRYQWYRAADASGAGAVPVAGGETASLTVTPGSAAEWYFCAVTNSAAGMSSTAMSALFTVTAAEPELSALEIETPPAKTAYTVGDVVDGSGLSLRATLGDGSTQTIREGFTLSPLVLERPGEQEITVSYRGLSCHFTVTVMEAEEVIRGIGVLTLPAKTSYLVGDALETEGLSIRVYTNNGQRDVSEGLSCSPERFDKAGEQTVTVSYGGQTCTFTVQVSEQGEASLSIARLPDKTRYQVGEALDPSGLELELREANGTRSRITGGYSCQPLRLDAAGEQRVTVSYRGLSCSFSVYVTEPTQPGEPATIPESPAPTPPEPEEPARSLHGILVWMIAAAAFTALAVLVAWLLLTRRDKLQQLLARLRDRLDDR